MTASVLLYDTTLRDGMQGQAMSLSVDEKLRVVHALDDLEIGPPGPITRAIQGVFEDALHGRSERYADWLDVVATPAPAPS